MKWTEFSEELWTKITKTPLVPRVEVHAWAVEQYRKLQRWNEEIREEKDEARRLAEYWRKQAWGWESIADGPPDKDNDKFPWEVE